MHNNNVNVSDPYTGKGLIFSRWKERNLVNARIPDDGFTESSGHEGDFIEVRRNYDWARVSTGFAWDRMVQTTRPGVDMGCG